MEHNDRFRCFDNRSSINADLATSLCCLCVCALSAVLVQSLDKYWQNVCELDITFNMTKVKKRTEMGVSGLVFVSQPVSAHESRNRMNAPLRSHGIVHVLATW